MQPLLIAAALVVVPFVTSFVAKRKFGVLALALAAGSILSGIWTENATFIVEAAGLVATPLVVGLVSCVIIFVPAVLLMFRGHKYKSTFGSIIGSLIFTAIAAAFFLGPLKNTLQLTGIGATVFAQIQANRDLILGGGLLLAIVETLFSKQAKHHDEHEHGSKH